MTTARQGHPPGLYILFFTEMWERFSYYGMRAILLLFLLDKTQGGMGLGEGEGGAIYGLYTFSVYLLSLPGGWLADNVLGQRKAIWYGGLVIMLGHIVLAFPSSPGVFFAGLGLVAIGTGLLKPNISSIVSELYPEGGARRDAAFSIFYMGINLGSFLGITVVGYLGQKVGWHYGFGAAAISMGLGLIVYRTLGSRYLAERGLYPKVAEKQADGSAIPINPVSWVLLAVLVGFLVVMQFIGQFHWDSKHAVATSMGVVAIATVITYFANLLLASGLTVTERKHVGVLVALFIGAVMFWTGYEQQGSSFQIFADRYSEVPFGIPSSWFQDFNPAFILIFAPIMASLWIWLDRRGWNPSLPLKFVIGLVLLGVGYYVMVIGAKIAVTGVKASAFFLTFTYLFHTVGELCLSPVGLSAYTKLSPKRYLSQLMGIWFVAAALGNLFAGLFAGGFDAENVQQMPDLFMSIVWFTAVVGGVLLLLSGVIKNWMGSVK